jgi:hypothetical protein
LPGSTRQGLGFLLSALERDEHIEYIDPQPEPISRNDHMVLLGIAVDLMQKISTKRNTGRAATLSAAIVISLLLRLTVVGVLEWLRKMQRISE